MKVSTKYDVGDEVWLMMGNKACSSIIGWIEYSKDFPDKEDVVYLLESGPENKWSEDRLYPSKEELIKSL